MPYSSRAEYRRFRQKSPKSFRRSSFRTVPLSHTDYGGGKFRVPGAKAVVGYNEYTGRWETQTILIPKRGRR